MPRSQPHNALQSLTETAPGAWKARYSGNYGTYTIKLQLEGGRLKKYSCTCPSDYSPCKHVRFVQEAIRAQAATIRSAQQERAGVLDALLQRAPAKELLAFIRQEALYSDELYQKLLRAWPPAGKGGTDWNALLRQELAAAGIEFDPYYDSDLPVEVEALDNWLEDARKRLGKKPAEALAMLRAYVPGLETWLQEQDPDLAEQLAPDYFEEPFDLLSALGQMPRLRGEVFAFALAETQRPLYEGSLLRDGLLDLLAETAREPAELEAAGSLLEGLLRQVKASDTWTTEALLRRLTLLARQRGAPGEAEALLKAHLRVPGIRLEYARQLAGKRQWDEVRRLGEDFLASPQGRHSLYVTEWWTLLLKAAEAQKDKEGIRRWSFAPLESGFDEEAYRRHKAAYTRSEWPARLKALLTHYGGGRGYQESYAALLAEEGKKKELLDYVRQHLSPQLLERWAPAFGKEHPGQTLQLFEEAIGPYVNQNTGRSHYAYVVRLLRMMAALPAAGPAVRAFVRTLKATYPNRRALLQTLEGGGF